METLGEIIEHISGQLSDQQRQREYIRWPRTVLLEYIQLALAEIATYRPDAITTTITLPLVPGAKQTVDTKGSIDSVEVNGVPLNEADISLYKAFAAYATCPPTIRVRGGRPQFKLRSISKDPDQRGVFYVSPPVPAGYTVNAKVFISGAVPPISLEDWDKPLPIQPKYSNNVVLFAMASAYKRDTESDVSEAKSQRLFSLFYQTMGVKYKVDSAYNSGYYKGEVGTGDPRAAMT